MPGDTTPTTGRRYSTTNSRICRRSLVRSVTKSYDQARAWYRARRQMQLFFCHNWAIVGDSAAFQAHACPALARSFRMFVRDRCFGDLVKQGVLNKGRMRSRQHNQNLCALKCCICLGAERRALNPPLRSDPYERWFRSPAV